MVPRDEDYISFKEHLEERLAAIENLQDALWLAHRDVHAMGQRAIDEAVKTVNVRLEAMNEFRTQIYQERTEFLKVPIFDSEHKTLETKLDLLYDKNSSRISVLENNQSNQAGKTAAYTSVVGVVFVLLQIFLHFWK